MAKQKGCAMTITLRRYQQGLPGVTTTGFGSPIDLTPYLDEESRIILTDELEQDMFEHVVGDLTLVLSDFSGSLRTLLLESRSSEYWKITVINDEGEQQWISYATPSDVSWIVPNEKVQIECFSAMRAIWDELSFVSGSTMANDSNLVEFTEGYIRMDVALGSWMQRLLSRGLCQDFNLPLNHLIRAYSTVTQPVGGERPRTGGVIRTDLEWEPMDIVYNEARLANLANDFTLRDLMLSIAHYYNYEWSIDYATEVLTLARRNAAKRSLGNLSSSVKEEGGPIVNYSDTAKYDYVHLWGMLPRDPAPSLANVYATAMRSETIDDLTSRGLPFLSDPHHYFIYSVIGVTSEGQYTQPTSVLQVSANDFPDTEEPLTAGYDLIWSAYLIINPIAGSNIAKRYIFRQTIEGSVRWTTPPMMMVGEVAGNAVVGFTDEMCDADVEEYVTAKEAEGVRIARLPAGFLVGQSAWVRYNEQTATWDAPLLDSGFTAAPVGRIFEQRLDVRFKNENGEAITTTPHHAFAFFGQYYLVQREQTNWFRKYVEDNWKELFITRRMVTLRMVGTDYRVGDEFYIWNILGAPRAPMVIKRVEIDLLKEETTVVALGPPGDAVYISTKV